jgi:nitronate monooxygenase
MSHLSLHKDYPWLKPHAPIIVGAPMMKITMSAAAVAISAAGGLGFLAAGFDVTSLPSDLSSAAKLISSNPALTSHATNGILPIGVGFQNWGADMSKSLGALRDFPVAAVWFFAPKQISDLEAWTRAAREMSRGRTKVWIQIGTVAEALEAARCCRPDVLVVQGADSGGHGLLQRAGLVTLLPEVADALGREGFQIPLFAAGGVVEGRGAAAALSLGAAGVVLGTRLLACKESVIAKGYQDEVLRVSDGGTSTVSTTVYDAVRGITGWPEAYTGRGVANKSHTDALNGMSDAENQELYKAAMKLGDKGWGPEGRMTTYAGTGVGLVREVKTAAEIVSEVQRDCISGLRRAKERFDAKPRL